MFDDDKTSNSLDYIIASNSVKDSRADHRWYPCRILQKIDESINTDKVYVIGIRYYMDGRYEVLAKYGRRGSNLKAISKGEGSFINCFDIFDEIVRKKVSEGYDYSYNAESGLPYQDRYDLIDDYIIPEEGDGKPVPPKRLMKAAQVVVIQSPEEIELCKMILG